MAKEHSPSPQAEFDVLRKENPELIKKAMGIINQWKPGENYLVTVLAKALRDLEDGAGESPPKVRRSRSKPVQTTRMRRTR